MALDKAVDSSALDADLKTVADAIRSKGGTSATLSFPEGMASAINAISTGVMVQQKNGTFRTDYSGKATVNCGFKPDAVFITGTVSGYTGKYHGCAAFSADSVTSATSYFASPSTSYLFSYVAFTQTSTGFTATAKRMSTSFAESNDTNRTFNYIAIKYTK